MNSNNGTARDASYFRLLGAVLHGAKDWASVPENFPYGAGALILNIILYQSELVPRWISIWGLIGSALMLLMGLLRLFGRQVEYLALPIILNELVLAVWLMAVGLGTARCASAIAGALFIVALVSTFLNGIFTKSMSGPDYLTAVSANNNRVLAGVLCELSLAASVVVIPLVMFPILRQHSETLALAYIVARIFEGFFDVVIALSQLLLLTLSREHAKAGMQAPRTDTDKSE